MWTCWHSEMSYNPELHGGERRVREEIAA